MTVQFHRGISLKTRCLRLFTAPCRAAAKMTCSTAATQWEFHGPNRHVPQWGNGHHEHLPRLIREFLPRCPDMLQRVAALNREHSRIMMLVEQRRKEDFGNFHDAIATTWRNYMTVQNARGNFDLLEDMGGLLKGPTWYRIIRLGTRCRVSALTQTCKAFHRWFHRKFWHVSDAALVQGSLPLAPTAGVSQRVGDVDYSC